MVVASGDTKRVVISDYTGSATVARSVTNMTITGFSVAVNISSVSPFLPELFISQSLPRQSPGDRASVITGDFVD